MLNTQCTSQKQSQNPKEQFRYLALGDSYTVGEGIPEKHSFPNQIKQIISEKLNAEVNLQIIAQTGWTSDELQAKLIATDISTLPTFDLVSMLIGVNNQYRGYDIDQFEFEYEALLDQAIRLAGSNPKHVFALSIPDYGVTPFALENDKDPEEVAQEIDAYNQIIKNIAEAKGVAFYDITEISREAATKSDWLAKDKLHPSQKMYGAWVAHIQEKVIAQILYKESYMNYEKYFTQFLSDVPEEDKVDFESNRSGSRILCRVTQEGTTMQPQNFIRYAVYDKAKSEIIYQSELSNGEVKWRDDKHLEYYSMPGMPRLGETIEDRTFLINLDTKKVSPLKEKNIKIDKP
ncbi:MAG: SGNH/GDSL hydrolase family protein [Bernardetiaceae bacterium]|nr:SGNH/GDSL hydrolase family protein [Bernardetiaceae bacterium]